MDFWNSESACKMGSGDISYAIYKCDSTISNFGNIDKNGHSNSCGQDMKKFFLDLYCPCNFTFDDI